MASLRFCRARSTRACHDLLSHLAHLDELFASHEAVLVGIELVEAFGCGGGVGLTAEVKLARELPVLLFVDEVEHLATVFSCGGQRGGR